MMKHISLIALFLISLTTFSQTKYMTKTGQVNFEASVPSFEEIKAKNDAVTAILNADNGEFAALILVKGFRFKNALMEEHFNENYAESDTYPKASFKGKFNDLKIASLKKQAAKYKLNGELTFHGKTKTLKDVDVNTSIDGDAITMKGSFKVNVSDFNITIPGAVSNKLSKTVTVDFDFILKKK